MALELIPDSKPTKEITLLTLNINNMKDMNPAIIALIAFAFLAGIGLLIATYKVTHL